MKKKGFPLIYIFSSSSALIAGKCTIETEGLTRFTPGNKTNVRYVVNAELNSAQFGIENVTPCMRIAVSCVKFFFVPR